MSLFNRRSKRPANLREKEKPKRDSDDDDEAPVNFSDIRELQEQRRRQKGFTAVECAVGKELAKEFNDVDEDPFRQSGGGQFQLSDNRRAQLHAADVEQGIREQFKKESLLRDEHEEMKKYIEDELRKRKAIHDSGEKSATSSSTLHELSDEALMLKAAERIKGYTSKNADELLSNQMLAGIPEVDLGISARISNIMETEQKKNAMCQKMKGLEPEEPEEKKAKRSRRE
ncbi:hypothetical protein QR680_009226 [Steinernema hermaphroditum]|uniref:Uncharacterized protein n=1 Tax=Steinernema hermaphroditum TaxID=289476 RepID=A0AA39M910_9BILA|nr:hypothetical protein QR680_009226 [Steinernema hermaphroditum]